MSANRVLEDMEKTLREHMPELEREFGVERLGIFGSYVRGEEREDSDVDILVEFSPSADIDLLDFMRLEERLSEILGKRVDLVMASALKPAIGRHVLKEVVYV